MIRLAWPEDNDAICRLALEQYQRTPWPLDMEFPAVHEFAVNNRHGHTTACCGYRHDGNTIRVMHVWAEDGFSGRRGAVELMKAMKWHADSEHATLVFTAREWNDGLRNAVERHGCELLNVEATGTVTYRREAR